MSFKERDDLQTSDIHSPGMELVSGWRVCGGQEEAGSMGLEKLPRVNAVQQRKCGMN